MLTEDIFDEPLRPTVMALRALKDDCGSASGRAGTQQAEQKHGRLEERTETTVTWNPPVPNLTSPVAGSIPGADMLYMIENQCPGRQYVSTYSPGRVCHSATILIHTRFMTYVHDICSRMYL